MRQVPRQAPALVLIATLLGLLPAQAQDLVYLDRGDKGFNLPGVSLPQGQDEVRAADGTSCRSAVGGAGTYLDVGAIKDSLSGDPQDVATYARVVIPLGSRPSRLDCAKLYALEIERLQMELRLLKMGVTAGDGGIKQAAEKPEGSQHWTQEGWTDAGVGQPGPKPAAAVASSTQDNAAKPKRAKPASGRSSSSGQNWQLR